MRIVLLTLVILLSGASAAAAAPVLTVRVIPEDGATAKATQSVRGTLRDGDRALGGQAVTLEARPAGEEAFTVVATVLADAAGGYRFDREFDRNQALRISAAGAVAEAEAFVFPSTRLAQRTERGRLVRLSLSFRADDADVRATSRFYVGPRGARTGGYAGAARIRRVAAGRFRASVVARVPKRYGKRFSFGACLQARAGSELGKPGLMCPRRRLRY